mgnify:CR=1 FL=1
MCGIVAYIGQQQAYPILIKGLQRLEYRGYDSAGVAVMNGDIRIFKRAGKVQELKDHADDQDTAGSVGIGHTRWATHGEPNQVNAHPHFSESKNLAIVHNGIIENFLTLKQELENRGYTFHSDTDTEVLIHLIEDIQKNNDVSLDEAVRIALNEVTGAYAIVVMSKSDPDQLIGARKGSPLVVGIGRNDEFFVASDATPIVEYTKNVVYLEDEEIVTIKRDGSINIRTIYNKEKTPYIQELQWNLEQLEKGGYEHFMLKEIFEQPRSIYDTMRGRIDSKRGDIYMGGMLEYKYALMNAKRILIVACGTSWHSALVGEYLFEDLSRIPVEVEYASEFRYRNPIIYEDDIVIAISQSGETADTLAAIELAKQKGATILGVCNVVGSSIPRATHAGAYTHAGPEIGVASTKAFTAQLTVLVQMALWAGFNKGAISQSEMIRHLVELEAIPDKVERILKLDEQIETISTEIAKATNALFLGRGYNFPVALEGALKLKEISYIHAEGYPAAEMKHGPIALIDEDMPVVVIATKNSQFEKMVSNIQEVKARKGKIFAIVTEGDTTLADMADHLIEIPNTTEILQPLLTSIPLQLISYHVAVKLGRNVDQPRNLAKSVTVE